MGNAEKAEKALLAKVGGTGETATDEKQVKKEYQIQQKRGKYNPRVHKDLGDKDYVRSHGESPRNVDPKKFKKFTGKDWKGKASGGSVESYIKRNDGGMARKTRVF